MTKIYACLVEGVASSVYTVKDRMESVAYSGRTGSRLLPRARAAQDFQRCRGFAKTNRSIRFKLIRREA